MKRLGSRFAFAASMTLAMCAAGAGRADPVEDFYRGKQIRAIVGLDAGSDYDVWMRLATRHWGRFIPGRPGFVVTNMPGAGQIVATNYIANIAEKDGTVVGTTERNLPFQLLMGEKNISFDPNKLNWIGSPENTNRVCAALEGAPVQKAADLFEKELIVGGGGSGSSISNTPVLLNKLLGMKFKLVEGYNTSQNILMAMERGEVQGICQTYAGLNSTRPGWIDAGKLKVLFSMEREPIPGTKIPTIYEYTKTEEQREIIELYDSNLELGRPLIAAPGVPAERVTALRRGFDAMTADPEFIAEAHKLGFHVTLRTGEELQQTVAKMMATPKAIIEKTIALTK